MGKEQNKKGKIAQKCVLFFAACLVLATLATGGLMDASIAFGIFVICAGFFVDKIVKIWIFKNEK